MHLTRKDVIATTFVGIGVVVAGLWAIGIGARGMTAVRVVTGIVLALGFAASASAVVPGFAELLRGSKVYLASTVLLGLVALAAGVAALVSGREPLLGVLVAATLALWAVSTVRHASAAARTGFDAVGGPATAP